MRRRSSGWTFGPRPRALPNYPNPFNPDTWLPFELRADAAVEVWIYDVQGKHVRTLQVGQLPAGFCIGPTDAVHWDGRHATGEAVASGVYLYPDPPVSG